jgi:hypothetical protein
MATWQGSYQVNLVVADWADRSDPVPIGDLSSVAVMVGLRLPRQACPTLLLAEDCVHIVPGNVAIAGRMFLRKEVIQPQVPLRLPCYDLVPITEFALGTLLLAVTTVLLGAPHFRGLTGGVYKAQEHIHRGMLTRDY